MTRFSFWGSDMCLTSLMFASPLLFLVGEDGYAIDIFSFGICALEVRETRLYDSPLCVHVWFFFLSVIVLTDYLHP